ncbi:GNAT family N-acetyltransferase [Massilia antarctica]|uniref:GNAT family N-acetyltransferase n=1 Tax=Massilia antarctica TaxID=2765360 RepID=UPI00226EAB7E|nr:GNAT family N-acetyltransferase [Massilia sp. H27-R4]MCY0914036.1 GNAT family N-acetyltransferase [Massilia sp. H27-R4]
MGMPDLFAALQSFQGALSQQIIFPQPCELARDLVVLKDDANGDPRLTFAIIENEIAKAIAAYLMVEHNEGLPCFQVGYAVAERFRRQGLAEEVLSKSLREMEHGFGRHCPQFYVEAVVDQDNAASRKVAERVFGAAGEEIVDTFCGKPAIQFLKLVGTAV